MKKVLLITVCSFIVALQVSAQHRPYQPDTYTDDDGTGADGFKKENLFLGGSLNIGYSGYDFNVGGAPEIGYSLTQWLDAGLLVNINYTSERADPNFNYNANTRQRSFTYGTGAFARAYPFPVRIPVFFQVEPEYNWTHLSAKNMSTGESASANLQASSLLLGVGYGQRVRGSGNFYIAIMFDAFSNYGSPYRDGNNAAIPVIKAGFDIYLHPGRH